MLKVSCPWTWPSTNDETGERAPGWWEIPRMLGGMKDYGAPQGSEGTLRKWMEMPECNEKNPGVRGYLFSLSQCAAGREGQGSKGTQDTIVGRISPNVDSPHILLLWWTGLVCFTVLRLILTPSQSAQPLNLDWRTMTITFITAAFTEQWALTQVNLSDRRGRCLFPSFLLRPCVSQHFNAFCGDYLSVEIIPLNCLIPSPIALKS